jgi:hypothetical protein
MAQKRPCDDFNPDSEMITKRANIDISSIETEQPKFMYYWVRTFKECVSQTIRGSQNMNVMKEFMIRHTIERVLLNMSPLLFQDIKLISFIVCGYNEVINYLDVKIKQHVIHFILSNVKYNDIPIKKYI